jgi:cysteine desulfurase
LERVLSRIYLDHAATTPMRPEAIAAVAEGMRRWANPSSPHAEGRAARAALEDARARIKTALGWDGELIFTSGASEALAIGLGRAKGGRRLVSAVEHDAVFRAAPGAEVIPVIEGRVDEDVLAAKLREGDRPVVAIQHVNSETGVCLLYNPTDPIIDRVREAGGIFLCDCAQSIGKSPIIQADMVVVSAHKLGGPPGIGALLVRDLGMLEAGGGQEFGYRGGTENLPGALGFAAAIEACGDGMGSDDPELIDALFALKDFVWNHDGEVVDGYGFRSAWIMAMAMPGISAGALLIRLDQAGFAVSAGSACSSGSLKPSRALRAFGIAPEVAARTIRVSAGWTTTAADIVAFQEAWLRIADEAKARA